MRNSKNQAQKAVIIDKEKALSRLQNLCARQEKCAGDIKKKLHLWKLSSDDTTWVITHLETDGFVDDTRYANMFVRDKSRISRWGRIKIASTLKYKGVSADIINEALAQIEPETDKAQLAELINRKAKQTKAKSVYDLKSKLIRFGVSRGFDMGLVIDAVNKLVKAE